MTETTPVELKKFEDTSPEDLAMQLDASREAFAVYRKLSAGQRANFLRAIAAEIELIGDELLEVAAAETKLPEARLRSERTRTVFQLRSYAEAAERGQHLELRIDKTATGKSGIRKMNIPLGPVVVFGAANFPFAYSTAGGDTACALAAGCTVIVKAHPAHSNTSELVAAAISRAAALYHLPAGVFIHVHGVSSAVGRTLVEHPAVAAVGFTGSFTGGRQLFDWAMQRKVPIPVFAEMSSVNPVFLLPGKLASDSSGCIEQLAASIVLGQGQFCTNPGLLVALDNETTDLFISRLGERISATVPGEMLNPGIFKNYVEKRGNALAQPGVEMKAVSATDPGLNEGAATLAVTSSATFLQNPLLQSEVFGPYSLLVKCRDAADMLQVAKSIEGQLTTTLMATEEDLLDFPALSETLQYNCGRFIWNGVPTGVEVVLAMQHGGPYPSTTDPRFTSVGADGIRRFVRPLAYQDWPDLLLPDELKDGNPLKIWRTVNNQLTDKAIG